MPEKAIVKITLRLPDELKSEVDQIASEELRSLNEQIVWILRDYVAKRKAPPAQ